MLREPNKLVKLAPSMDATSVRDHSGISTALVPERNAQPEARTIPAFTFSFH